MPPPPPPPRQSVARRIATSPSWSASELSPASLPRPRPRSRSRSRARRAIRARRRMLKWRGGHDGATHHELDPASPDGLPGAGRVLVGQASLHDIRAYLHVAMRMLAEACGWARNGHGMRGSRFIGDGHTSIGLHKVIVENPQNSECTVARIAVLRK
jgi:hypothetical protein